MKVPRIGLKQRLWLKSKNMSTSSKRLSRLSQSLKIVHPLVKEAREDPSFLSKTSFLQLGYGIWVNLSSLTVGLAAGFSAVAIPQIMAPDSKVKATLSDEAWITSVLALTSPIGSLVCGYCIDIYGRRKLLVLGHVPLAVGWLITGFATLPIHLIIGRLIAGFGLGLLMIPSRVYLMEISLPNMRGILGTLINLAMGLGLIVQALMGHKVEWHENSFICAGLSIGLTIGNFFLPETPYFVLLKNEEELVMKSLKHFRAKDYKHLSSEIDDLMIFKMNNVKTLTCKKWLEQIVSVSSMKPFCLMVPYMVLCQLAGINVLFSYDVEMLTVSRYIRVGDIADSTGKIWMHRFRHDSHRTVKDVKKRRRLMYLAEGLNKQLSLMMMRRRLTISKYQESDSNVDPNLAAVILTITRFLGAVMSAFMVYHYGRRTLSLASAIGCGVIFIYLGSYLHIDPKPSIQPLICYTIYVVFACLGYYPLTLLILFELLPLKARGIMGGFGQGLMQFGVFATNEMYPFVKNAIKLENTLIAMGVCSIICAIYLFFFLPETKKLTLQQIEDLFKSPNADKNTTRENVEVSETKSQERLNIEKENSQEYPKTENGNSQERLETEKENSQERLGIERGITIRDSDEEERPKTEKGITIRDSDEEDEKGKDDGKKGKNR